MRSLRRPVKLSIASRLTPLLNFTRTSGRPKSRVSPSAISSAVAGRFFSSVRHDPHLRFPLFPPPVQLTGESGDEKDDQREREMDENVIAVHGGTS